MTHYMKLTPSPFLKILNGDKTIELRINDEKRQKITVGDTIIFSCTSNSDTLSCEVKALHKFDSFKTLYQNIPLDKCGYTESELNTAHYTDMEKYYSKEQIEKNGALGIELILCTTDVSVHYDMLIDENNDPVHDPKPLREYMDKWDGQDFIDKMQLDEQKSVLEIGVGTGRLAIRVAPLCAKFCGIDISPKTVKRAKENLADKTNVTLHCADFLSFEFSHTFDVIYSSLTFMHIEQKQKAINKVVALLKDGGKFVLSIDKNQDGFIDTGTRKITVFPDTLTDMKSYIANSGLILIEHYETEFAHIFVAKKKCKLLAQK